MPVDETKLEISEHEEKAEIYAEQARTRCSERGDCTYQEFMLLAAGRQLKAVQLTEDSSYLAFARLCFAIFYLQQAGQELVAFLMMKEYAVGQDDIDKAVKKRWNPQFNFPLL